MANTSCLFLNNYQTTLGALLTSTGTTMTVSSVVGLPASLTTGQFIPMTLTPASSPGSVYEIVYVTGISGANLTITRGNENTSALNWSTGDILYSTNTAGTTQPAQGAGNFTTVTASGLITANGGIDVAGGTAVVPNATAANEAVALGQSITGATFRNVTSSRAFATTYTNSSGRPMFVFISLTSTAAANFYYVIEGVTFYGSGVAGSGTGFGGMFIVLPGQTYSVNNTSATITNWYENS